MSRGYFAIGSYHPDKECNIGTMYRSAYNFGAQFIYTIGRKYKRQCSDTVASHLQIPMFEYQDFESFYSNIPKDCMLVGVELDERAIPIKKFSHPERAIYLMGNERNGLPKQVINRCHSIVQLPGKHCLNVSSAATVVLFDRLNKE